MGLCICWTGMCTWLWTSWMLTNFDKYPPNYIYKKIKNKHETNKNKIICLIKMRLSYKEGFTLNIFSPDFFFLTWFHTCLFLLSFTHEIKQNVPFFFHFKFFFKYFHWWKKKKKLERLSWQHHQFSSHKHRREKTMNHFPIRKMDHQEKKKKKSSFAPQSLRTSLQNTCTSNSMTAQTAEL